MARASDILRIARAELGVTESPAGSNRTKYGKWYGLDGQPWCMMFVQWVFAQAGAASLLPARTASCGALMRAAKAAGQWVTSGYQPGDVAIYDFPGGGATDHCGIIATALTTGVRAIEGNTGTGNDANGGKVMERTRQARYIVGAFRPDYDREEEDDVVRYERLSNIPESSNFRNIADDLMTAGIIAGDGSDPTGNGDRIDLSHDMVRMLAFNYRAGVYDAALKAAGIGRRW